jgi:hypothetical protein
MEDIVFPSLTRWKDEIEGEELENGSLMYGDDTEVEESHDDDQNNDDTVEETNNESNIVSMIQTAPRR